MFANLQIWPKDLIAIAYSLQIVGILKSIWMVSQIRMILQMTWYSMFYV